MDAGDAGSHAEIPGGGPTRVMVVAALALVALGLAVAVLLAVRGEDEPAGRPDDPAASMGWSSCGPMQCATMAVPLDHADPGGRRIELAVARRPATGGADERIGVLLVNPGGPGASGIDFLHAAPRLGDLAGLNERFDLVSWDPRGVGGSTRLDCDGAAVDRFRRLDPDPDDAAEQRALDEAAREVARSCAAEDAGLAANLGTDQTVGDLEAIRTALGEEQVSWLGFSYGTHLGLRYGEAHPERVRAMVLDGALDPTGGVVGMLTDQAEAFEAFLDETVPDGLYEAVDERLDAAPVRHDGEDVGPAELAVGTVLAVYDPFRAARLTGVLQAAQRGEVGELAAAAASYRASGDFPAYVGTLCADGPFPTGATEAAALAESVAARAPRAGAAIVNEVLPCAFWQATDPPAPAPVRGVGLPTVVVVGTTGDVATPLAHAEAVAAELDDAVLVVREGGGHTGYSSSACVQELVGAYLVDLAAPAPGTRCRT